ncbi:MAG TPA: hypothetical protein VLZ89_15655 [Anaerolineales bacterium]|nr:hypothetical protein [Anaerolineales bacterium]
MEIRSKITTQEYIESLRRQLRSFSPEEQETLIEEIRSHIAAGEEDPGMGKDLEERRNRVMKQLGSPQSLGDGFKAVYRPDRLIDWLLIAIPYLLYPYLNSFYLSLMPKYSWADIRLDVAIHLPLVVIGLWRRSAPLALFWVTIIVSQLFAITTLMNSYYGLQTIFWAVLLLALLSLAGHIIWQNRHDLLIVIFGVMPLGMCVSGNVLSAIHPTDHTLYNLLDRLLLIAHLYLRDFSFDSTILLAILALFLLPSDRRIRWLALVLYGLMIGVEHAYLTEYQTGNMALLAHWVHDLWVVLPALIVMSGWWLERSKRPRLDFAMGQV